MEPIEAFRSDNLNVQVYHTETEMGNAAADFVAGELESAIALKGFANLILATGSSQFAFIEALLKKNVQWDLITVFHLDEYLGISDAHPASFRRFLKDRILNIVKPHQSYLIRGDAENITGEVEGYETLLRSHPIDVACIGIGENGHIAFNDPPVADFEDPKLVKVVELDEACRKQQVGEGWFPSIEDVPTEAVTLTITAIMNSKSISCVVPGKRKSIAVHHTLNSEMSTKWPATILRVHPNATLFLDREAREDIEVEK